jgi:hypothetical protein
VVDMTVQWFDDDDEHDRWMMTLNLNLKPQQAMKMGGGYDCSIDDDDMVC